MGGMHRGGRGDARASCASPLGTPLVAVDADVTIQMTIYSFQGIPATSEKAEG